MLIVVGLILNKKWNNARIIIKELLDIQPKKEVCLLMSKIEEGESGDIQKRNSWILRSQEGKEKNFWVCMISNKYQETWSSFSEGGYFNSLEWRRPFMLNKNEILKSNLIYDN